MSNFDSTYIDICWWQRMCTSSIEWMCWLLALVVPSPLPSVIVSAPLFWRFHWFTCVLCDFTNLRLHTFQFSPFQWYTGDLADGWLHAVYYFHIIRNVFILVHHPFDGTLINFVGRESNSFSWVAGFRKRPVAAWNRPHR